MPRPTARFRQLAARWLVDTVTVQSQTAGAPTRATMAAGDLELGTPVTYRALVRQASATDTDTATADRSVRELSVWLPIDSVVAAGDRVNLVTVLGDHTLDGGRGTVLYVDRDTIRPLRRLTVRMPNDA